MRVERLELTNFRGIRHLELEFPTQTTVLVGINGVGKSAILDALAMMMSVLIGRLHGRQQDELSQPSFMVSLICASSANTGA